MNEKENLKAIKDGVEKIDLWIHDLNKERINIFIFLLGIFVGLLGNIIANGLWNLEKPLTLWQQILFVSAIVIIVFCFFKVWAIQKMNEKKVDELNSLVKSAKRFLKERKK